LKKSATASGVAWWVSSHIQMTSAKPVMVVPSADTICPDHMIRKPRRPVGR